MFPSLQPQARSGGARKFDKLLHPHLRAHPRGGEVSPSHAGLFMSLSPTEDLELNVHGRSDRTQQQFIL